MITISKKEARGLLLEHQGLLGTAPFGKGKKGVLATIQQLGYLQIDTISVVERAHHHTLLVRVPNYQRKFLDELQRTDKQIFEYWSHAAAYLPLEAYRFATYRMQRMSERKEGHWFPRNHKVIQYVKDRINAEGPLMSKDFKLEEHGKSEPWWGWKPTKMALEQLFHEGELMIHHRQKFQKVYDLTERVLPNWVDTKPPSTEEYCNYLIDTTIRASGLARAAEIRYLRKGLKQPLQTAIAHRLEEKTLVPVRVNTIEETFYSLPEIIANIPKRRQRRKVHLLCPFDNAIIQRKRVIDFFDFDYKLECYVPAPKRKYGYFSLAILFGDQFAGHLDLKADRKTKQLIFQQLTFEPTFKCSDQFFRAFGASIIHYAKYNNCEAIDLSKTNPTFKKLFNPYLNK